MVININTVSFDVTAIDVGHVSFNGHLVQVHNDDGLALFCSVCGHGESFDCCITGLHKWEATCYLLSQFPDDCNGDGKETEERIREVLDRYVGKPADRGVINALEDDVRDVVGDSIAIDIHVP